LFQLKSNVIQFIEGIPIQHGQPERWKVIAQNIGRTKPTRASRPEDKKRKKNDGRPPDTKDELLKPMKAKATTRKIKVLDIPKSNVNFGPPSYPWKANSCWLDTFLELLFVLVMRNFAEFTSCFASTSKNSGLFAFFTTLDARRSIGDDEDNDVVTQLLVKHRDNLRLVLKSKGIIKDIDSSQPFMVCYE
jgi:hypothetical protein